MLRILKHIKLHIQLCINMCCNLTWYQYAFLHSSSYTCNLPWLHPQFCLYHICDVGTANFPACHPAIPHATLYTLQWGLPTGACTPPVGSPHWGVHAPQWAVGTPHNVHSTVGSPHPTGGCTLPRTTFHWEGSTPTMQPLCTYVRIHIHIHITHIHTPILH
jgi:hypothetical protein